MFSKYKKIIDFERENDIKVLFFIDDNLLYFDNYDSKYKLSKVVHKNGEYAIEEPFFY